MSVCVFLLHIKTDNPLNTFKNHGFRPLFECGCFTSFRFDYDDPKFIELTVLVNQVLTQPAFFFPANFVTALQFVPSIRKVCTCFVLNPFGTKRTHCGCRAVKMRKLLSGKGLNCVAVHAVQFQHVYGVFYTGCKRVEMPLLRRLVLSLSSQS